MLDYETYETDKQRQRFIDKARMDFKSGYNPNICIVEINNHIQDIWTLEVEK
jgi:hypothetical protein